MNHSKNQTGKSTPCRTASKYSAVNAFKKPSTLRGMAMKPRLDSKQLMNYYPPDIGVTINYDHEECSAGRDTRKRLYLTGSTHTPGLILAYCHNCGCGGSYQNSTNSINNVRLMPFRTTRPSEDAFEAPGFATVTEPIPVGSPASEYLVNYGLSREVIERYGFAWDVGTNRLYIPLWGDHSKLRAYQLRRLNTLDYGPKYITVKDKNHERTADDGLLYPSYTSTNIPLDTVVICEDLVSALRVTQAGNYCAFALLSSTTNSDILFGLAKKFEKIIVWLDNDNGTVLKHAKDMFDFLCILNVPSLGIVTNERDPKHFNDEFIRKTIQNAIP